jgi:hypothetical protein
VLAVCVIVSMYGGGFATIPAYLADMFGTRFVGAIHGRLLTAWSTAGIIGPVLVNYIREAQREAGMPLAQSYNVTMYILAALLVFGLAANLLVKPLDPRRYMGDGDPLVTPPRPRYEPGVRSDFGTGSFDLRTALAWTVVSVPIAWGLWVTLSQALVLFSTRT